MKKNVVIVLLVIGIVLGFIVCGSVYNKKYIGGKSKVKVSHRDVSLTIIDDTLKNTGATIAINNNSDKTLRYTEEYEIEIKVKDDWHKINVDQLFNMPLWGVEPNNSIDIELKWEDTYGKLDSGKYRIVKNVYFEGHGDQNFYIAAEFTIK